MHSADDQRAPPRPSGWLPRHRDAPEVQRSRMVIFLSSSYFCVHVNLFPARFMLKHLAGLSAPPTPEAAVAGPPGRSDGPLVRQLQEKFPLLVFSCLQLSSKLLLHSHVGQPVFHKLPSRSCDSNTKPLPEDHQRDRGALPALGGLRGVQADGAGGGAAGLQGAAVRPPRSRPADLRGDAAGGAR